MDSHKLPAEHLKAGRDYLDALVSLGLRPHYLGWGWDRLRKQWLLVLATQIVDAGGPLALNQLLFRAYNAKATPKEISPFIVRVFSPEIIPMEIMAMGAGKRKLLVAKSDNPINPPPPSEFLTVENLKKTFLGIDFEMAHSYESIRNIERSIKRGFMDRRKEWNIFKSRVEKLAA
jgi:hypothetical protein